MFFSPFNVWISLVHTYTLKHNHSIDRSPPFFQETKKRERERKKKRAKNKKRLLADLPLFFLSLLVVPLLETVRFPLHYICIFGFF